MNIFDGINSGTFAHLDIAFEFASWISAEFKLYLVQEFERLNAIAKKQYLILQDSNGIKKIEALDDKNKSLLNY